MEKIRVLVVGYGNVGRGVLLSLANQEDMEVVGIATRSVERVRKSVNNIPVVSINDPAEFMALSPDVAILCGGSKNDLPQQGPEMVKYLNTVDSFDNHSCIPQYHSSMDAAAKAAGHVAVISTGWDPGIFSLERTLANAFLPGARSYGFYGLSEAGGLSMGHSDALRTIKGVADARQFTHAVSEAVEQVRRGENPDFSAGDMHTRECFVVLEAGADAAAIEAEIKAMPGYFAPYKTTVNFVTQEELNSKYNGFPHDGCVVAASTTGAGNPASIEYRCRWASNPEATANVLVAHARAAVRMNKSGDCGAKTILDIPPKLLSSQSYEDLLKKFM
ncbi:MAG: diaminopimelate dehydrogenase [Lentisphaerae bacterium]|nr:diaminopimelate dehydrogenase [Lentisphaerota bacterium]